MRYMVIAVIDELEKCPTVLKAWEDVGVVGITILESTGLGRFRQGETLRDDLPLMPSLRSLLQVREEHHRTMFTIVDSEAMIERIVKATEMVVGDLDQPHTGILFALPVVQAYGLLKSNDKEDQSKLS